MKTETISLDTSGDDIVDLTDRAQQFVAGLGDGLLHLFAPHATAGLALIETGSGTERDLRAAIDRVLPRDAPLEVTLGREIDQEAVERRNFDIVEVGQRSFTAMALRAMEPITSFRRSSRRR